MENTSSESVSGDNDAGGSWKGVSNYFDETDEVGVAPPSQEPKHSPQTFSNFETTSDGKRDDRTEDVRIKKKHRTNNRRLIEQNHDDTSVTIEQHLASNVGITSPVVNRYNAGSEKSSIDEDDVCEVVPHVSAGQDLTDDERHDELSMSRHASESMRNAQQRHLVDSPALIQRYLLEKEGTDDAYPAAQPEATAWLPTIAPSAAQPSHADHDNEERPPQDPTRAHKYKNFHKHSRKTRARSDSVSSSEQDRRPLRDMEPATSVSRQPSSVGQERPSSTAEAVPSLRTEETKKTHMHRWASSDDLDVVSSLDIEHNNTEEPVSWTTGSTKGDFAVVTQSTLEFQRDNISEQADESLMTQSIPPLDVERVARKSTLPPLSRNSNNYPDTSLRASKKTKRSDRKSEQHARSDDEAAGSTRRKRHRRQAKQRQDDDSTKAERTAHDDEMMTACQDDNKDDVERAVNEGGDGNRKESRKHHEKHHGRGMNNSTDGHRSKPGSRPVGNHGDTAIKDLVISYKKSHREKATKISSEQL